MSAISLLLVDDDLQILETAQDILEAAGFTIYTAETGAAALRVLGEHPCQAMIADFNLDDTTGVELAIQAKSLRPALKIVLMTGEANVDITRAQGAIETLMTKPVNPSDLIELIRKIC